MAQVVDLRSRGARRARHTCMLRRICMHKKQSAKDPQHTPHEFPTTEYSFVTTPILFHAAKLYVE